MRRTGLALIAAFGAAFWSVGATAAELDLSRLAEEWQPVAGVSIASKHVGAERDFQEFNPGVSLGARRDIGWRNGEWGVEVGVFQNSYDEGSFYAGLWADWPVVAVGEAAELRFGAFFAYAEYPQLVDEAKDFGAVTIGDFVPLLAAQASLRLDERFAFTMRFGPGVSDSDLILGLQMMYLL